MISSQKTSLLSEVTDSKTISLGTLEYFRERLVSHIYALVMQEFSKQHQESGFKKANLAKRIQKDPGLINRLLSSPGNWTLETLSDLLLGLGAEPVIEVSRISRQSVVEAQEPDWLKQSDLDLANQIGEPWRNMTTVRFDEPHGNVVYLNMSLAINTTSDTTSDKISATGQC